MFFICWPNIMQMLHNCFLFTEMWFFINIGGSLSWASYLSVYVLYRDEHVVLGSYNIDTLLFTKELSHGHLLVGILWTALSIVI